MVLAIISFVVLVALCIVVSKYLSLDGENKRLVTMFGNEMDEMLQERVDMQASVRDAKHNLDESLREQERLYSFNGDLISEVTESHREIQRLEDEIMNLREQLDSADDDDEEEESQPGDLGRGQHNMENDRQRIIHVDGLRATPRTSEGLRARLRFIPRINEDG